MRKPLLQKLWLKGKIWKVQYEGIKMIFFKCGKIGHSESGCKTKDFMANGSLCNLDDHDQSNLVENRNKVNNKPEE